MHREPEPVELEQPRIEPVHLRLVRRRRQPREPGPQHRPPAGEGHRPVARRRRAGAPTPGLRQRAVGRGDQIGRGVRQRPVEVEDRRPHRCLLLPARPPPLAPIPQEFETESDPPRPFRAAQWLLEPRHVHQRRLRRMPVAVIVLAAGQGTRMNSDLPKVLHPLAGAPLIAHALAAARALEPERTILVTGHGAEAVARRRAPSTRTSASSSQRRAARHRPRRAAGRARARRLRGRRDRPLRRHAAHPPRDAAGDARGPRRRRRRGGARLRGGRPRRLRPAGPRRRRRARARSSRRATRRRRELRDPPLQLRPARRRRGHARSTCSPRSATTTPRASTT